MIFFLDFDFFLLLIIKKVNKAKFFFIILIIPLENFPTRFRELDTKSICL